MEEVILRTVNLTKKYKNISAFENINMTIKKGQIYGFIGQNGAGKSSFMRTIVGLALKTSGDIELFGESDEDKIQEAKKRIGCLIESPAFYEDESVYINLNINRIQKGIPGKGCIDEVLTMVGLLNQKYKKAGKLSTGMKQKLGIAMAMLGKPEFLILDEPINGIDPMGIVEIRELLKKLNLEQGVTILISSHILGELYQLANCYGIINKGKLIEELTLEELNEKCKRFLYIEVDDVSKSSCVIEKELHTKNFEVLPQNNIKLYDFLDSPGEVSNALFRAGIMVKEIRVAGEDLETYFTKAIRGEKNA
ncbi:ATP-binding cassette domain-containing protein [Clostridium neuense]|uniref:ATP-binding cassette domain-containing protein n=1 Tax=Clostridium neuense TaxID=1728934 RepID=A0ABW8TKV4_9CLOT